MQGELLQGSMVTYFSCILLVCARYLLLLHAFTLRSRSYDTVECYLVHIFQRVVALLAHPTSSPPAPPYNMQLLY